MALADTRPKAVASLTLIARPSLGREINGAAPNGIGAPTRVENLAPAPWLRTLVADETTITDGYARLAMAAPSYGPTRVRRRTLISMVSRPPHD